MKNNPILLKPSSIPYNAAKAKIVLSATAAINNTIDGIIILLIEIPSPSQVPSSFLETTSL